MIRSSLAGEPDAGGRFNMIRADGTHFIGEFNCCPLRNALGLVSGVMIIARDVTERQQQDDELKSKNQELERFTYTVSHDLKSPLITIKGFAGALLNDVNAGRTDRLGEDLKRIVLAADKMTALLNGLLELSRVGRIVNAPVEVSMDKVAHDVVELLSGPIKQQQATVTVQPELPAVHGDPQRLQTVLQNLVENALFLCATRGGALNRAIRKPFLVCSTNWTRAAKARASDWPWSGASWNSTVARSG